MDTPREVTPEQQAQIAQILGLPPGSKFSMEQFSTVTDGRGKGSNFESSGDKIITDHKADAPTVALPGVGNASGGASSTENDVAKIPFPYVQIMFGVAALVALGAAAWSAKNGALRGAIVSVCVAGVCVVGAFSPGLAAALGALIAVGAVGFLVWSEIQNKHRTEAIRAAGEAITSPQLSDDARRQVLAALHQAADGKDIVTINQLNHADGLPSVNPPLPRV